LGFVDLSGHTAGRGIGLSMVAHQSREVLKARGVPGPKVKSRVLEFRPAPPSVDNPSNV